MYTLYFTPGACSQAIQIILRELNQTVALVNVSQINDFTDINPVGAVPALVDGNTILREGAAIILYLLNKHSNDLLPEGPSAQQAIQNIMFANATMHPAYSRLFFISQAISDQHAKFEAFNAAASNINILWDIVEKQLEGKTFLAGEKISAADILLTVYSQWGDFFPVDIILGENVARMINAVSIRESFKQSIKAEKEIQD